MMKQKRGSPRRGVRTLDVVLASIAAVLIIGGIWHNVSQSKTNLDCAVSGTEHQVTVRDDTFKPAQLTISRCDAIKVSNLGTQLYEFAFGQHDNHVSYPGFTNMQLLRPNEYFVIDAATAGDYTLHDHLRDQAHLHITIKP